MVPKEEGIIEDSVFISYGCQTITEQDIASVCSVLRSDWLTQGPKVPEFEQALCQKFGSQHVTVVCNGTAALHIVGLALGWQEGDVVLTTPLTFLASANCILYAGATPDFVDIDPTSYTINPNQLEPKIKSLQSEGKKVKAVVAVDYAGYPCDWEALRQIAGRYELQLVDDACHAMGATYKNELIGSSKHADASIFSFHPVKHMTTGEGGAVLTNQKSIDKRAKQLRTHGVTKEKQDLTKDDGPWYYEMHELGFNYRITDFQCALGINQLQRLEKFVASRQRVANYYNEVFGKDERFIIPYVSPEVTHAYHLYPLQIKFDLLSIEKRLFFERLREKKIIAQVHYIPIHLQPYYRKNFYFKEGDFPIAEAFYQQEVSLPMYPSLETNDLEYITTTIFQALDS